MRYFQIKFHLEGEDITPEKRATAFDLTAALSASAGLEIFDEDGGDLTGYVQEDLFDKSVLESVLADFPMEGITVNFDISKADYEDWNAPWEEAGFEPIVIDQRCVIHDMKHTPPSIDGALDIVIDAHMAFGTGTHETTQMMVGELLRHDLEGKRVLDCGCGTGILSIVASKSGASDIVAYDIDEWSVENTEHNARLNGIDNIEVLTGDGNLVAALVGGFLGLDHGGVANNQLLRGVHAVGNGVFVLDLVDITHNDGARYRVGRDFDLEFVAGLAHELGHDHIAAEDDFLDGVEVFAGDGDLVAREGLSGAEGLDHDRFGVL